MRYPQSVLDEIRQRLPVSTVVGRKVQWDRRKTQASRGDYWACCPFHQEKTPSFHADDRRGHYHCFGCGAGGDQFTFLTELDNLTFPEAVKRLADEAGVVLPEDTPEQRQAERRRLELVEVVERAAAWFQDRLAAPSGGPARDYLTKRGISADLIERFRIGLAPDGRTDLKSAMLKAGATEDQLKATGLVVHGDDVPISYDRFRNRIMWPVADSRGRLIAFGGRDLSGEARAKYLNSPDTSLFSKGSLLFNWYGARQARGHTPVLVEGYMDVTAAVGAGFLGAVAPMGTAVSEEQLQLVWRLNPKPVACFDGDEAGTRAALRLLDLALPHLAPERTIRFAMLEPGKDPAEIIQREGVRAFRRVLEHAQPLVNVLWRSTVRGRSLATPEDRAAIEGAVREKVDAIKDQSVKREYRADLRERLRAVTRRPSRIVRSNGHSLKSASPGAHRLAHGYVPADFSLRDATRLVAMLEAPNTAVDLCEELAAVPFRSIEAERVAAELVQLLASGDAPARESLLAHEAVGDSLDRALALCSANGLVLAPSDAEATLRSMVAPR